MKETFKLIAKHSLTLIIGFIIVGAIMYFLGRNSVSVEPVTEIVVKSDTVYKVDTFVQKVPHYIREVKTEYKDTIVYVHNTDTLLVEVPIVEREYKDSMYRAIVRGYNPTLQHIETYNVTRYIDKEIRVPFKTPTRLGIGLNVGGAYVFGTNRIEPVISFGLQYNLFTW